MSHRILDTRVGSDQDSDPEPKQFNLATDPDMCWAAWLFCAGIAVIAAGLTTYILWLGR